MNAGWYVSADVAQASVYEAATKALAIDPGLARRDLTCEVSAQY